jgi:hypothetical protein
MQIYMNKYKIKHCFSEKERMDDKIPEGTAFVIDGINGSMLDMQPVRDIGKCNVIMSIEMLNLGFYKVDTIP